MMKNNIYIIGAGAIGKALAVFLKLDGRRIVLLRGSVDERPGRSEKLDLFLPDGSRLSAEVEVDTLSNLAELDGLIVLTSKSYGNESIAQKLKNKAGGSPIVVMQNGLEVERPFINGDFPDVYRCVLFATSQIDAENRITFKPVSASPIGVIKGNEDRLVSIVESLSSEHFPFQAEHEIQPVIWKKAIINSVFNSICPLLEVDNGIFQRDEKVLAVGKRVIEECVLIAAAKGIHLESQAIVEKLLQISKSSDGQLISTLQDIRNKRETEIATLNLEIAAIAASIGRAESVRETKLLGELTKLKSELSRAPAVSAQAADF